MQGGHKSSFASLLLSEVSAGHLAGGKQGCQSSCYLPFWDRRTVPGLKAATAMRLFPVLWPFSQDGSQLTDAEQGNRSGSALS